MLSGTLLTQDVGEEVDLRGGVLLGQIRLCVVDLLVNRELDRHLSPLGLPVIERLDQVRKMLHKAGVQLGPQFRNQFLADRLSS